MESAGGALNFLNKQVGGKNILGAFSGQRLRNGACRHFRYDQFIDGGVCAEHASR